MRAGRQQPPKTFAKLVKINQSDDEKAILDMRTEFLNMYYPVAKREKSREAELDQSLLYPQYDQKIIRGMVHDEIFWTYSQAQEAIRNSKEDMKEIRQPFEEQTRKLKDAIADMDMKLRPHGSETRISTGLGDPADALKSANAADRREYLRILDHKSVLPESDEEDEVEETLPNGFPSRALKRNQLVGNNELNVVKNWAVRIAMNAPTIAHLHTISTSFMNEVFVCRCIIFDAFCLLVFFISFSIHLVPVFDSLGSLQVYARGRASS